MDAILLLLPLCLLIIAFIVLLRVVPKKYRNPANVKGIKIVSLIMTLVIVGSSLGIIIPALSPYLVKFDFLTEPVVFDSGDTYSIMYATSKPGSSAVDITNADGSVTRYTDAVDGVGYFSHKIHRVDVPKEALDNGASYVVSSRKSKNTRYYGYSLGKEIKSASYKLKAQSDSTDVKFMTISDIQGAIKYAEKAVDNITNKDYDFILMLGDYCNQYNSEDDFIRPMLGIAARAGGSTIPVVYLTGNHEIKGTLSREINRWFPTPSPENKRYFTYVYKNMHIVALDLGDDHSDDMPRYSGVSEFDAYKDVEYDWLVNEVMENKNYENYKYNIAISHIPLINSNDLYTKDYYCNECNKAHGYKHAEFIQAFEDMGITNIISAHTHSEPRIVTHSESTYNNLQTGSKYYKNGRIAGYRNSIVTLSDNGMTFEVYES